MKVFPYPMAIAVLQLVVGLFYALPMWVLGVRKAPKITLADLARLLPIAVLNAIGHASAVYAMCQKGGGSFTHVIKASEPVVSVILGLVVTGTITGGGGSFPSPTNALGVKLAGVADGGVIVLRPVEDAVHAQAPPCRTGAGRWALLDQPAGVFEAHVGTINSRASIR
jgi:hypothetical protein